MSVIKAESGSSPALEAARKSRVQEIEAHKYRGDCRAVFSQWGIKKRGRGGKIWGDLC